uniref:Uncharacterized protein n=1 Tax=Anguilla anguilla TaxID=7936 RepID=A0A0E9X865_ANGAN
MCVFTHKILCKCLQTHTTRKHVDTHAHTEILTYAYQCKYFLYLLSLILCLLYNFNRSILTVLIVLLVIVISQFTRSELKPQF